MTGVLSGSSRGRNGHQHNGPQHDGGGRPPAQVPRRLLGEPVTGSARWMLALAMFAAVMGASLCLRVVLASFDWWLPSAVVVAGTLVLPALLRRWPALGSYAPLGALAGWFMALTLVFFPATAILGFIPTPRTVEAVLALTADASNVILTSATPVPAAASMSFLVAAGLGFVALAIDTVALTVAMPAASSLGFILILLPPALTTKAGIDVWGFAWVAAGFLLVLGCCRWYAPEGRLRTGTRTYPSRTLTRAVALGAVVVLLMAAVPAIIPGFSTGTFPQGARLGKGSGVAQLDAMIALGVDLRSPSNNVSLTYLTNMPSAEYLRLNTLENFTGQSWQPSAFPDGLKPGVTGLSATPAIPPALPRTRTVTRISTVGLQSSWLPSPLSVTSVENLDGQWVWNPSTQTIQSGRSSTLGQSYVVNSEMPELNPGLLAAATASAAGDVDPVYTQLPPDVPAVVSTTAKAVAGSSPTPYAKAVALQEYLRSSVFSYSLATPVEGDYDGSGMAVLASFLQKKSGYCVHFSAAMAVMAREMGIPSRIAVGYAPGASTAETAVLDGQQLKGFQASGLDAHAWPELFFAGVGWVPFEPTPSRGSVPDYSLDLTTPVSDGSGPTAPAVDQVPTLTATATPSATAGASGSAAGTPPSSWLLAPGISFLVLILLGAPALTRAAVRRRRLARVRDGGKTAPGAAPELVAWRELLTTASDYGSPADPALTPALNAERIAHLAGVSTPGALALLLHAYEQAVYGRTDDSAAPDQSWDGRPDLADALETLIFRIQTHATVWQRLRASIVPASFFRKRQSSSAKVSV